MQSSSLRDARIVSGVKYKLFWFKYVYFGFVFVFLGYFAMNMYILKIAFGGKYINREIVFIVLVLH